MTVKLLIILFLSYLLGSIPTAYWMGKVIRGIDIRQYGSGNVGATNAFRVLGRGIGLIVLALDILKGFLAVKLALLWGLPEWAGVLTGIFAIAGHNWTVFLSFKGGKGVASSAGVFMALVPRAFLVAFIVFLILVSITRYVSVGSICASIVLPMVTSIEYLSNIGDKPHLLILIVSWLAGIFVIIRHRSNIERIRKGTENRLSFKGSQPVSS